MSLARVGAMTQWAAPKHSIDTITDAWIGWQESPNSSQTWTAAQTAVYIPVRVPKRVTVVQLGISCNTTATGTIDLGIYYPNGTRIVSTGATSKSSSVEVQVIDCTDTVLNPGLWFLAALGSNATDTFYCYNATAPVPAARGIYTEAVGSATLPATATFAIDNTFVKVPVISAMLNTVVT